MFSLPCVPLEELTNYITEQLPCSNVEIEEGGRGGGFYEFTISSTETKTSWISTLAVHNELHLMDLLMQYHGSNVSVHATSYSLPLPPTIPSPTLGSIERR